MATNRNQNKGFETLYTKRYDINVFGGKVTAIFSIINYIGKELGQTHEIIFSVD